MNRFTLLKALCITLLALGLSMCLAAPFSASVSSMFSSPEKTDFVMSDLFASVADHRPVRYLDDRIVLVDIAQAGRGEMAEALEILSFCQPAAVGLDVHFAAPKDPETDARLIEAISHLPMLVLPLGLSDTENDSSGEYAVTDKPFFHDSLPDLTYAAANLAANHERATIRKFPVKFRTAHGDIPSFSTAIAALGAPVTAERLLDHQAGGVFNNLENIDFPSREFNIIPIDELADHAEGLNGKFVLIGALSDAFDMHATPVNSYMSGLMIHAYSLATILDGNWYTQISDWADYALAFTMCFLLVWLCVSVGSKIKSLMLRLLQVLALYAAVRIGYALYVDNHVIFNFSHTFLMLTFGLFAVDIWNGTDGLIDICRKGWRKHKARRNAIRTSAS